MSAVLDDKTLRIVRIFNAPRDRVFDAWVVEDNFIQWMCPPNVHVDEVKLDTRPGGGTYVEIKRPERLVFTWAHHETNDLASPRGHETTVHLEFRALGDKTELTLIHGPFADTASCENHHEGWTGSFEKLETYLRRPA
ncbi:MAG TPA: SRPBCC domain-containing protein [Reyranella sp.]